MTDDDRPIPDDELIALLRRISDSPALQPQHRDRARATMLAQFDAIVSGAEDVDEGEGVALSPPIELDDKRRRTSSRSFVAWGTAVAATCLVVVTLVVGANLSDDSATSDSADRPLPISVETLPGVEAPLTAVSFPVVLEAATYRTDDIRDGLAFSGAEGLHLVALGPGLMVLDSVSDGGDLDARVTVFQAERTAVNGVIDAAGDAGHLQIGQAQFAVENQSIRRRDLTVAAQGVADLGCVGQSGCLPLTDGAGEFDPSIWARSENFLVEAIPGDPSVFVLVQTKGFGDPLLSQAFEIIQSLRLD